MKMRHKETGEIIDLPDYIPEYEDAREIARVFMESDQLSLMSDLPLDIVSLKTYTGDVIQVSKITDTSSHFPYEKLIRIHLHLSPFKNIDQLDKSIVWSVKVNGQLWTVGDTIYDHVIEKLEWTKEFGWWAITETVYAVQLSKVNTPDQQNASSTE